jgi:hypothetical protein
MAYIITKSDGTTLTTVQDGQYDDTTTSLSLIGKNLFNYGQLQNENFVYLLENFAKTTAPVNQMRGQLWFDTSVNSLKVYTGSLWRSLAGISLSSSSAAATNTGTFWYDTVNGQLSINTGSSLALIGPEGVPGYGTTRMMSTTLNDGTPTAHPVILFYVDGEVVSILSASAFTLGITTPVPGFTNLVRGLTFKNVNSNDVTLYGASTSTQYANYLLNEAGTGYIAASTTNLANTIVQRDGSADITVNGINASSLTAASSGTFSGVWNLNNDFIPNRDNGVNLGTQDLRWANVYSTLVDSPTANIDIVNFSALTDLTLSTINRFDTDVTLAANANNRLSTQRAVKTYVDNAISTISLQSGYTGSQGFGYTGSAGSGGGGGNGYVGSRGSVGYTGSGGGGGGSITAVTASTPLVSSGGSTPNISMSPTTSAGTYGGINSGISSVTVDTYGRVTAISTGSIVTPPTLFHVTSGYTGGGRVVVKNTAPLASDFPGTVIEQGDIWFDPSAGTGYTQLASQNGWTKLPNGILIQWGRASPGTNLGEGYRGPFNFNTNFVGVPWTVVATPYTLNTQAGADVWLQVVTNSITASQFYVYYQRATSPSYGLDGFTWIAIGQG